MKYQTVKCSERLPEDTSIFIDVFVISIVGLMACGYYHHEKEKWIIHDMENASDFDVKSWLEPIPDNATQSEQTIEKIKLKWQEHNRDNGMTWNEIAELVNQVSGLSTEPESMGEDKSIRARRVIDRAISFINDGNDDELSDHIINELEEVKLFYNTK